MRPASVQPQHIMKSTQHSLSGDASDPQTPVLQEKKSVVPEVSADLYRARMTWKDRMQPLVTPRFHELEDIDFSQPGPGTFQFPNALQENGNRTAYKELHERSDILAGEDEPFFKQIQAFCQRWAVWAAGIENDDRRKEVLEWVFTKMLDAWKYGIVNGHYKFGPFEAAEKERLLKESRIAKRNIDPGKKAAPFVVDGSVTKDYNIVNAELEKHGITMEMINRRIEDNELEEGEILLQLMTSRVQGEIKLTDWKQGSRWQFKAGFHDRNLFMYALWEVQRCRRTLATLEKRLEANMSVVQVRTLQNRIEPLRTRGLQHLALAIELDIKDPVDRTQTNAAEDDVQDSIQPEDNKGQTPALSKSGRRGKQVDSALPAVEEHSSDLSTGTITEQVPDKVPPNNGQEATNHHLLATEGSQRNNLSYDFPALPDLPELPPEFSFNTSLDLQQGEKRLRGEGDDDQNQWRKKSKIAEVAEASQRSYPSPAFHEHEYDANNFTNTRPTTRAQLQSPQVQQGINGQNALPSFAIQANAQAINDEGRRQYLTQVWQPKMDQLLRERAQQCLTWPLTKWSDVRNILMNLNINSAQRNEYLREYKRGLAIRGLDSKHEQPPPSQTSFQPRQIQDNPQPHPTKLTLKIPQTTRNRSEPEKFDRDVHETRGFSFRCLPEANPEQRARLDDLINDYVTEIIHRRVRRHGTYIIMHDPQHKDRMPIAHGLWNHKDQSPVEGMAWFYAGHPIPNNLDLQAYHINDFDEAKPAKRTKKAKAKAHHGRRTDRRARVNSYYADDLMGFDDPEDDDYDPSQF